MIRRIPAFFSSRRRIAAAVAVASLTPILGLIIFANCVPLADPWERATAPGMVILDADGVVLQRDTTAGVRIPVALDRIAPHAVDATIAAEDKRFRSHPGVDLLAISRAVVDSPLHPSGASTLSQQTGRLLYHRDPSGPWAWRKGMEVLTAIRLDAQYSKDEILSLYMNEVYYGRGAYGIEAAARVYFGTAASQLNLARASFLAALPQQPTAFDTPEGATAAAERHAYVLDRMAENGVITRAQANAALEENLDFLPELPPVTAPHFVQYALEELERQAPGLVDTPGIVIETTLDAPLFLEAERLVRLRLSELEDKNANNAAVVVLDPRDGRILAMVGNADFEDALHSGQVNMATALRQPGSALKPFLYAAAMESGYTAATSLLDVPTTFQTDTGPYSPLNYDRRFHGVVSMRTALASSLNIPAVRTFDALGIDAFLEIAHRFGLSTLTNTDAYGLALTLGGGEVRLVDLTAAYGALATGGSLTEPYAIERVLGPTGEVLYEHAAPAPVRVLDERHDYILTDILSDDAARLIGFGTTTTLSTAVDAAVKTGTTTGFRDNWTLGYTPERAVGVWVGNADNSPMLGTSGVDGAAPIWRDVLQAATRDQPSTKLPRPNGIVAVDVCPPDGRLPGPSCPATVTEFFVAGTEPQSQEDYYVRGADGVLRHNPPVEARAWAREAGLRLADAAPGGDGLLILRPTAGSIHYLAPELSRQELLLQASAPAGAVTVAFYVDGLLAGTSPANPAEALWNLEEGEHSLRVVALLADGSEVEATTTFTVAAGS